MAILNRMVILALAATACIAAHGVAANADRRTTTAAELPRAGSYDLDMALCVEPAFAEFIPGVPIEYQVTITNLGEDHLIEVSIGDWQNTLCTTSYPSLGPGETQTYLCTYTPSQPQSLRLSARGRAVDSETHWAYTEVYSTIGPDPIFRNGFEP